MHYIFNKDNKCIGKCSFSPNQEDLSSRQEYSVESSEDYNIFQLTYQDCFVVTEEEIVVDTEKEEHRWVKEQLKMVDIELMYHWTGDTERQTYTDQIWKDYAIALRNYTTLVDNIPVVNSEVRPTSPYNIE